MGEFAMVHLACLAMPLCYSPLASWSAPVRWLVLSVQGGGGHELPGGKQCFLLSLFLSLLLSLLLLVLGQRT